MEIILLSPDHYINKETESVNQFFEMGLQRFHLRKFGYSLQEFRNYFLAINPQYHSRIVLHGGGYELYEEFETAGIHLNSTERSNVDKLNRTSKIPREKVSSSFHSWSEIINDKNEYGYVFISPVFDSISKTNYKAAIDIRGLAYLKKRFTEKEIKIPRIFALGGIDIPHIPILQQYHFDGAVVFGAVWNSSNPALVLQGLLQISK